MAVAHPAPRRFYPPDMPLTPGDTDTDNEGREGGSQMAGRKRSAGEMEDEGGQASESGRDLESAEPEPDPVVSGSVASESEEQPRFVVQCPAPDIPVIRDRLTRDGVLIEDVEHPLQPRLRVTFAVSPGEKWLDVATFVHAKFDIPTPITYSRGQIVYINRHDPPPPAPPASASEEEKLKYDQENLWVGYISQIRAENKEKVYCLVFWLYWPDELPMGRQPYHGPCELVLSNHADIVDAQSFASHADISRWDENDDSNRTVLHDRYWRQTLDVKKLKYPRRALSKLRKFCICGGYDNPELDMFQCRKVGCGLWNHEECLVESVEKRAWEMFQKGALTHEDPTTRESQGMSTGAADEPDAGEDDEKGKGREILGNRAIPKRGKKLKASAGRKNPWARKLEGKVNQGPSEGVHYATVTQLVPSATSSRPGSNFQPKTWNFKMLCLKCGESLN